MNPRPLTSYKHPHHLVAALVLSGRHGHTGDPDATLGWAMDRAREHEERENPQPQKSTGDAAAFALSLETGADPRAEARARWRAYQTTDLGIRNPTEPHRLNRSELAEYLREAWPDIDTRRARLAFEHQGTAQEIQADLAGQSPTGYWLADQVDDWCEAELARTLGGSQLSLI